LAAQAGHVQGALRKNVPSMQVLHAKAAPIV
jgi:hypothetical protein